MIHLVLAALFLPASHFLISSTSLRGALVRALGEKRYTRAYSLLTLAAFAWLVLAFRGAPAQALWSAPAWLKDAMSLAMLPASLLVVAGVSTPNPTIVGQERLFERNDTVRGILRVTRNPFLWGAGLFALAHAIAAGETSALLAFGSVAVLGFAGMPLLEAKKARNHRAAWTAFASETSSVPLLAILRGRQRLQWREIGIARIGVALGLYLALLLLHRWFFGADPLASF